MNAPNDPAAVFWQRASVQGPDECWLWTGGLNPAGYGTVWIQGKQKKATHIALELHGKPRPGRSLALHSCDNPACVNPRHLRWGNHQQNADDKVARSRWRGGDPTIRANFKATPELVAEVLASTETGGELSRRLGVSKPVINRIRRRNGSQRRTGRPTVMRDRVFRYFQQRVDENHMVTAKHVEIGQALGMAHSNVNVAIKALVSEGRLERIGKSARVWTYRVA